MRYIQVVRERREGEKERRREGCKCSTWAICGGSGRKRVHNVHNT